ncbi:hypothetical protein G9A89_009877 [Geosiphon pyriformis]|nr:hypothetical protein G9A89_009877 [Geosiphon pyriformis]
MSLKEIFWASVEYCLSNPNYIDKMADEIKRRLDGEENIRTLFADVKMNPKTPKDYALLGFSYEYEIGTEANKDLSIKFYTKAAESGDPMGQLFLAAADNDDMVVVFRWQRKAALQGVVIAQATIGHFYGKGDGVDKDELKGFYWSNKSAETGHFAGQWALARCYRKARGTNRDIHKAIKLYRKSAEQGFDEAFENLEKLFRAD